ncbi:WD repeat-containing protein 64 [Lamellibrachia satsuma]|nr:WD repeat-containing protein 64 [Lamellibrachia satsuma]
MSEIGEKTGVLQRPYTVGTFQRRLREFQELIKELTLQDVEASPDERRQMITENLRYDQFCDSIRALFGNSIRNNDLKAIYRKITTNPDAKVDWSELFGSESEQHELSVGEEVSVFMTTARRRFGDAAGEKKRRDIVISIKYLPQLDCYLTASQKGAVSLWSSKDAAWVTGCDYMPVMRRVAVCTERSLCIWDVRAKGKNQRVFTVKPIEHSPQCLVSIPRSTSPHEDTVMFGDDQGYINILTITTKDLTMKNNKGDRNYSQSCVIDPGKLSYPIKRRKFHDNWVLKVKFFPELRCFASCSANSNTSFFLEEIDRIYDDIPLREVAIPKGVNAFDFCARANVLATGGVDKVIRVWHPHIFSRPTGKLIGHLFTIVDITTNEKDQHIISLSTARVFRIWDIQTLTCLQVFSDNEDRPGEKRIYSILFDNKRDRMISGSSVLDTWPLTRAIQDTMQVPLTHDRPINQVTNCCSSDVDPDINPRYSRRTSSGDMDVAVVEFVTLYNVELNQVITVCSETIIKMWEADSGKLVYQITEAHGSGVEVTAIAMDKSGYRLATGALDGSLKIWDFGSGQEIKRRVHKNFTDDDVSVLGLAYCSVDGQRCLIAIGWSNKMQLLLDSDCSELSVLREFSDTILQAEPRSSLSDHPFNNKDPLPSIGTSLNDSKEQVVLTRELSCLMVLETILVTGCNDGDILVWDIPSRQIELEFAYPMEKCDDTNNQNDRSSVSSRLSDNPSAVNVVAFLIHKVHKLDPAFIKRLTRDLAAEPSQGTRSAKTIKSRATSRGTTYSKAQSRLASGKSLTVVTVEKVQSEENALKAEEAETNSKRHHGSRSAAANDETISEEYHDEDNGKRRSEQEGGRQTGMSDGRSCDGNTETMDSNVDPANNMITETYEPVLVACYQDSFIRFWNLRGDLLGEATATTRRHGSAVTAICADEDCNIIVTGDDKGYLTLWDVSKFLENQELDEGLVPDTVLSDQLVPDTVLSGQLVPDTVLSGQLVPDTVLSGQLVPDTVLSGQLVPDTVLSGQLVPDTDAVKQLLSWRAHLTKVVQLQYVNAFKTVISASTDGSVRIWWGVQGSFVGFYGQHKPINYPLTENLTATPVLPYDINEGPLAPVKSVSDKQKVKSHQHYEYPLVFASDRWKPFRRSAYMLKKTQTPDEDDSSPVNKKFFDSLMKPRLHNDHLERFTSGELKQGAVFRALPVYRVSFKWFSFSLMLFPWVGVMVMVMIMMTIMMSMKNNNTKMMMVIM